MGNIPVNDNEITLYVLYLFIKICNSIKNSGTNMLHTKCLNVKQYNTSFIFKQLVSPIADPNVVVLEQVGPTQIPVNYVDIGASQTPSPAYLIDGGHEPQVNF